MVVENQAKDNRIYWIDSAKAIGMFLVYFGHVVQEMANKNIQYSFILTKFIYSFHMPLFFILAGFFFKRRHQSEIVEIKYLFYRRIIPVLYFGILMLPLWPIYMWLTYGWVDWSEILLMISNYYRGHPELNTITWFLVCLFVTELFAILILNRIKKTWVNLLLGVLFLRFGLVMTSNFQATVTSLGIEKNFWYLHEAIVAFGLYIIGFALYKHINTISTWNYFYRFLLSTIFVCLTIITFNLNIPYEGFVVIMKNSNHGSSLLFLLTAFTGSFAVILISTIIPSTKLFRYLGKNSLLFIATSGIFHHLVNPYFVNQLKGTFEASILVILSLIFAGLSLLLSIPLVRVINKFTPQLVGKPLENGPWLSDLDQVFSSIFGKFISKKQADSTVSNEGDSAFAIYNYEVELTNIREVLTYESLFNPHENVY